MCGGTCFIYLVLRITHLSCPGLYLTGCTPFFLGLLLPTSACLGSTSGNHWLEIEGVRKGEASLFLFPSKSESNSGDAASPAWLWYSIVLFAQSYPTLCNPMDCSPPGSSVHGLLQARILEWVAISFSRGSSQPGD